MLFLPPASPSHEDYYSCCHGTSPTPRLLEKTVLLIFGILLVLLQKSKLQQETRAFLTPNPECHRYSLFLHSGKPAGTAPIQAMHYFNVETDDLQVEREANFFAHCFLIFRFTKGFPSEPKLFPLPAKNSFSVPDPFAVRISFPWRYWRPLEFNPAFSPSTFKPAPFHFHEPNHFICDATPHHE